jgi:hypothetical protein
MIAVIMPFNARSLRNTQVAPTCSSPPPATTSIPISRAAPDSPPMPQQMSTTRTVPADHVRFVS